MSSSSSTKPTASPDPRGTLLEVVHGFLLLLACAVVCAAQPQPVSIRVAGDPPEFQVHGSTILRRINNPNFTAIFQLTRQDTGQVVTGEFKVEDGALLFRPAQPLEPGAAYRATFSLVNEQAELVYTVPKPAPAGVTVVERIYPTAAILPENQLKFYVHFSAPMSKGQSARRIHLLEEGSGELPLPLHEELWDRDLRRLTILLDPSQNNNQFFLKAGRNYKLIIEKDWLDAQSLPLVDAFVKSFSAAPADHAPLDPRQWTVTPPAAGAAAPLTLDFPKPIDAALLLRFVDIVAPDGKPVPGKVALLNEERRWSFTPAAPWQPGRYTLEILATLEDIAGNRVASSSGEVVAIPITIQ